jgi:hypothetical protein
MVLCQPPDDAQVRHYRLVDAGYQPALCLLIARFPWGQVIRYHLPRRTRPYKLAQGIEYSRRLCTRCGASEALSMGGSG